MAGITSLETLLNSPVRMTAVVLAVMVLWFMINWGFPLVAYHGRIGLLEVLKESFALAVSFPGKTFGCIGITIFMVLLSILCPLVLLGTASCTFFLVCRILRPVLRKVERMRE